jgi:hypothetical protein
VEHRFSGRWQLCDHSWRCVAYYHYRARYTDPWGGNACGDGDPHPNIYPYTHRHEHANGHGISNSFHYTEWDSNRQFDPHANCFSNKHRDGHRDSDEHCDRDSNLQCNP